MGSVRGGPDSRREKASALRTLPAGFISSCSWELHDLSKGIIQSLTGRCQVPPPIHATSVQADPGLPETHLPGTNPTASLEQPGPEEVLLGSEGKTQLMKTKVGKLGLVFMKRILLGSILSPLIPFFFSSPPDPFLS